MDGCTLHRLDSIAALVQSSCVTRNKPRQQQFDKSGHKSAVKRFAVTFLGGEKRFPQLGVLTGFLLNCVCIIYSN